MIQPTYSYYEVGAEKFNGSNPDIPGSGGSINDVICTNCVYLIRTSDSNGSPFNSQGYAVGYDKVIEELGPGGSFGSTEYEYDNRIDEVRTSFYGNGVPVRPSTFATRSYPLNGTLKKKTDFAYPKQKIKETANTYVLKKDTIIYGMTKSHVRMVGMAADNSSLLLRVYPTLESNFVFLSESVETSFENGLPHTELRSTYSYDNAVHRQLTKKTFQKSDELLAITEYKYAADYTDAEANSAIMAMKGGKHMHNVPVEVTTKTLAPDGSEKVVNREFTIYGFSGPLLFPKEKIALTINQPALPANVPAYVPATSYNTTLYRKLFSLDYDAHGNLMHIQKTSDMPVTYLWGYNNSFPVAEIRNALNTECYYTSFEEDGDAFTEGLGGSLARTGDKVKNISSYTFPSEYTPNESNTWMSYWFWSNNKWNFSGPLPFQRTVTFSGSKMDEVRAFPKQAQMKTFTYNTLVGGVSSITDENSQSQYFEYDLTGRLKLIRNADKQILKTFFYHYRK
jgi:hypothetical protein